MFKLIPHYINMKDIFIFKIKNKTAPVASQLNNLIIALIRVEYNFFNFGKDLGKAFL